MSKLVLILSTLGLTLLMIVGMTDPNNPIMWMASTSESFTYLRGFLVAVLLGLLFTQPPRNVIFRGFVGLVSLIVASWALSLTYNNNIQLLDTMSLLLVCVSAGLTVLERDIPFSRYQLSSLRRS